MVEKDNIKHFIESGREFLWTRETLKKALPLYIILSSVSLLTGIEALLEMSIIAPIVIGSIPLLLVLCVLLYIYGKKNELFQDLLIDTGLGSTLLSLQFLCITITEILSDDYDTIIIWVLLSIYIFLIYIFLKWITTNIRKDKFIPQEQQNDKKNTLKNLTIGATVGAVLVTPISKMVFNLDNDVENILLVVLGAAIAMLNIFGTVYFLKAYYVKKYGFTDPYEDGWYKPKRRKLKEAENEEEL